MFKEGITGTLMSMEKSNQTKLGFEVWFPFVREHMMQIREGSLVAVRNFSSSDTEHRYSVLRITSAMPTHYALMTGKDGYPGFMEEAARSASKDWEQKKPIEDTTKIRCDAVPTNLEIRKPRMGTGSGGGQPEIASESSMSMPGERVRVLDDDWTGRVINRGLQQMEGVIKLGTLTNSPKVDILALWDSMIRTHFGVFAYTNAGKSNLLSTLASELFNNEPGRKVKMVVYDLMGEYGALLVDMLYNVENARIVCLSPYAVPDSVRQFWKTPHDSGVLEQAARKIIGTTILPKRLVSEKDKFLKPVRSLLQDGKIRLLSLDGSTLEDLLGDLLDGADSSSATQDLVKQTRERIEERPDATASNVDGIINFLEGHPSHLGGTGKIKAKGLNESMLACLHRELQIIREGEEIDTKFKISMDEMTADLNNDDASSLYVIQDGNDVSVRTFSNKLGSRMLNTRRRQGRLSPTVSFVYDEADQFIAQDDKQQLGMRDSKYVAEQLARRGRKYGLGIGIATQRIIYLATNILGQPHTYFVSRLPRETDRTRIQEAFGLSDEAMQESLRFGAGQWLLMSHSATGMDGIPIPIQLPDANDRIIRFLDAMVNE